MDAKGKVSRSFKRTFSKFGRDPIGGDTNDIGQVESNAAKNYHYQ
jgi:hypothetical protein